MSDRPLVREELRADSSTGIHRAIFIGMVVGLVFVLSSFIVKEESIRHHLDENFAVPFDDGMLRYAVHVGDDMLREVGVVFISVWGISLFYEKYIAQRHFTTFHSHLVNLVARGETNAAVCEAIGIIRIYRDRRSYEQEHSFAEEVSRLGEGDYLRIIGRSLIFTMYSWQRLMPLIKNGGVLQLCFIDPLFSDQTFNFIAGYSSTETALALERFKDSFLPWLQEEKPKGEVQIRLHNFALLDSYTEKKEGDEYRSALDLNFGEGLQNRYILYVNTKGIFGEKLATQRYNIIWDKADAVFEYQDGHVRTNKLPGRLHAVSAS